jgi:putative endonuclease
MPSYKQKRGAWGEDLACEDLLKAGYVVIARNVRPTDHDVPGEIDIIATRGDELHFVEVRLREGDDFGPAIESFTAGKKSRVRRAARALLDDYPDWRRYKPFFSVVAIDVEPATGAVHKEFIPDAFM